MNKRNDYPKVEVITRKEVKVTKLKISFTIATDTTISEDKLLMELRWLLSDIKIPHSDFTGIYLAPIKIDTVDLVPEDTRVFATQKVENFFYMKTADSIADGEWEELENPSGIVATSEPTITNDKEWSFYER
tara:strand:- start:483 stop:878 length:396 start_codon:yes stop_codon:yes gene_type:complete